MNNEPKLPDAGTGEIEGAAAANVRLGWETLKLEREKFEFDKTVRAVEIEHQRLEAVRSAEELEIKKRESFRSRWTNPFIVAIIGAMLVGIGNIAVTGLNGYFQRNLQKTTAKDQQDLADRNNDYSRTLEELREENTNVLEIVKLGEPEKIRAGLCMLVKLKSLKSPKTIYATQSYIDEHHGCPDSETKPGWATAQLVIPGCGESGCTAQYQVCGAAPANTKTTGNVRNYTDSFGGAWGDWVGPPTITPSQVCRTFNQHSHNVTRIVSFQFEVVPTP